MSFLTLNEIAQQTEKNARDRLSKLSKEEIDKLAKSYRQRVIKTNLIFTIFSAIAYIAFFCCLPIITEGESIGSGLIICIIIAIATTGLFPILILIAVRKPNTELALREIKQNLNINSPIMQSSLSESFTVSRELLISTSDWAATKLLIDNDKKTFVYQKGKTYSKIYNFNDLISYEVYENGKSKVQGRAGAALIGGAFFGIAGLIVGSSMSRSIEEKCKELKLFIRLNDIDGPQIVLVYAHNVDLDKSGWTYRKMKENVQSICSILEYMLNEKTLEQSCAIEHEEKNAKSSSKKQLQELKEMLDDGLITQEDYEKKKKQILGL